MIDVDSGRGIISGVSVSHGRATVEDLESAAAESQSNAVEALLAVPAVEEAFVLQTCNRVEAYVVGTDAEARAALARFSDPVPEAATVCMDHEESLRHLLRVAAGLESVVIGEDQILGQVRDAYHDALGAGGVGPILEDGLTKAIHFGERARSETTINDGSLSLASAAVRLAVAECALEGTTGLVVGAGEMGGLAAAALAREVDRLVVANRTVPHAEHVVESVDVEATAVGLDALPSALADARVAVTATGSDEPVVTPAALASAGDTFVVDLGQPRDVPAGAVADAPDVTVRDLDDLESVTEETRRRRHEAAERVEAMVETELDRLLTQYKRKRADAVISAMYEGAERVKADELETALSKVDFDAEERAIVESMADAIVSQLLSAPTKSLRNAAEEDDWSTIHTALELFDPSFDSDGVEADGEEDAPIPDGVSADAIPEDMRQAMPASVLNRLSDD